MKTKIVKPVGAQMVPFPSVTMPGAPFYAPIPTEGVRVEWPGPDGYWVRLRNDGAITVEDPDAPVIAETVPEPKTTTKKPSKEG